MGCNLKENSRASERKRINVETVKHNKEGSKVLWSWDWLLSWTESWYKSARKESKLEVSLTNVVKVTVNSESTNTVKKITKRNMMCEFKSGVKTYLFYLYQTYPFYRLKDSQCKDLAYIITAIFSIFKCVYSSTRQCLRPMNEWKVTVGGLQCWMKSSAEIPKFYL